MRQERRQLYIEDFVAGRSPQAEKEFLAECGVEDSVRGGEMARAVRQSAARSCGVDESYIRATDRFSHELYLLWGEDSLDSIEFYLDLEARLYLVLSDSDAERIKTPFGGDRTVADMVRNVYEVVDRPPAAT